MKIKMKHEEAYNLIELCLYYDKQMSECPERYDMALQIARDVFHKQTPVKLTYYHRYAKMGCAFCGNLVDGWEESPNYCPNCGQKIGWTEDEA